MSSKRLRVPTDRAREHWKQLGRSEKWIQQRMSGQDTRNKLTDYWKEHGVVGVENREECRNGRKLFATGQKQKTDQI